MFSLFLDLDLDLETEDVMKIEEAGMIQFFKYFISFMHCNNWMFCSDLDLVIEPGVIDLDHLDIVVVLP